MQVGKPPVEYVPAGQMFAVALVLPAGQAYPAGHWPLQPGLVKPVTFPNAPAVQLALQFADVNPVVDPYRPALQLLHVPDPLKLNLPMGQMLPVALVVPTGHAYPARQGPLQDELVAAEELPKVPAGHKEHTEAPPREYRPGGHALANRDMEEAVQV